MPGFHLFLVILFFVQPLLVAAQDGSFPLPDVPKELRGPEARANYLALHYWDRYDFSDDRLIGSKEVTEQGFSNFISIMPYVTEKGAAFGRLAERLVGNGRMLDYFVALGVKYLYEPASPIYDDALYILMLEKVLEQESLSEKHRQEFGFDLRMARKNRVGSVAADFSFITKDGKNSTLHKTKGEYLLLFLGDPECEYCVETKEKLLALPAFMRLVDSGRLKVLSVCVEGKTDAWKNGRMPKGWIDACDEGQVIYEDLLYEIPGLPVLLLLDKEHRVLMKNVYPGMVESFLMGK